MYLTSYFEAHLFVKSFTTLRVLDKLRYSTNVFRHENLKIVKGDAYDIDTFEAEISGKDAVLSCIGSTSIGPWATTTLYSETIKLIIEAMKR